MHSVLFREIQLTTALLLTRDSYISWSTRFVSLKVCVRFPILDFVSILLRFIFLFSRNHGLFDVVIISFKIKIIEKAHTVLPPPRLKLTLPWWGGFPPRSFKPSASTRRAQLSVAAKVVRQTDLLKNVRYWFIID